MNDMLLAGRTAIVTGGGRGLGRAFVGALAAAGAAVLAVGRNAGVLESLHGSANLSGLTIHTFRSDLSERGSADLIIGHAEDTLGSVDILVNNAGISDPALLWNMTDEQWDSVIATNLTAVFECTRAAARRMVPRQYGRIINVTSAAGIVGSAVQVNYGAAKAGVIGLTKSAARQLAPHGITVNAIAPVASTDMTRVVEENERYRARSLAAIPMGRFATPAEVAPAVVFLASELCSYTTGAVIPVDGGMSM